MKKKENFAFTLAFGVCLTPIAGWLLEDWKESEKIFTPDHLFDFLDFSSPIAQDGKPRVLFLFCFSSSRSMISETRLTKKKKKKKPSMAIFRFRIFPLELLLFLFSTEFQSLSRETELVFSSPPASQRSNILSCHPHLLFFFQNKQGIVVDDRFMKALQQRSAANKLQWLQKLFCLKKGYFCSIFVLLQIPGPSAEIDWNRS